MEALGGKPRIRRKSSAIKVSLSRATGSTLTPIPYDDPDTLGLDDMSSENVSIYSNRAGGVGSQLSVPNLPSAGSSLGIALENLRNTVEKRISTLLYLKRAHGGKLYWFNTVLLNDDALNKVFSHDRMRSRTTRFAVLGMSLSALLDITAAHDFLRGLLSLVQEFESVPDDKFDRKNRSLFRVSSRARKGNTGGADFSMGLQESGDASYLFTPNVPFELDYFQVFLTTSDMLVETYQKILFYLGPSTATPNLAVPPGFPQPPSATSTSQTRLSAVDRTAAVGLSPALADVVLKIDARLKKLILLVSKELDAMARTAIKTELNELGSLGGVEWGQSEWGESGMATT